MYHAWAAPPAARAAQARAAGRARCTRARARTFIVPRGARRAPAVCCAPPVSLAASPTPGLPSDAGWAARAELAFSRHAAGCAACDDQIHRRAAAGRGFRLSGFVVVRHELV